jgi:hypothetical protein
MNTYNLESYNNISVSNMVLDESVLNVISTLTNIFGISTVSQPKPKNVSKGDEWKRIEPFKATKLEKTEGIDTYINIIRTSLNKLSAKTYDTHKTHIIDNINNIMKTDESIDVINHNISIISKSLFDIVSNNKFYSNIYANLFSEFVKIYDFFNDITNNIPEIYMKNILNITPVDQNKDYDKFCEMNKENDKRKSLITFIINLVKNNTLSIQILEQIYNYLDNILITNINNPENTQINDEIVENIFIILTDASELLHNTPIWESLKIQINIISKYKSKDHKGISSRAIFKYMDMATIVNKIV